MSRFLSTGLSTLSSLREQLTELTSEVLNESTQEVDDPVAQLNLAKKRVVELEQAVANKNAEVESLRSSNNELQERVSVFEYELHQAAEKYRRQIEEKEAEMVLGASQHHQDQSFSPPLSPTADFSNFERRKLEEEIKHLKAECQHWKQLVTKQNQAGEGGEIGEAAAECARLRSEVMTLQRRLDETVEGHQNELASLQDLHRSQMSDLLAGRSSQQPDDGWGADSADWNDDNSDWNTAAKDTAEDMKQENVRLSDLVAELRSDNAALREEKTGLERSLEDLDSQHSKAIEQLLADRKEADRISSQLRRELAAALEESSDDKKQSLLLEEEKDRCRELSKAYEELNGLYEEEKARSGAAQGHSRDLDAKLEALKRDLSEYEENYERCRRDNQQSLQQLERLNGELDRLKAEHIGHAQTKRWREETIRLSEELEESLRKREELAGNVTQFQQLVDRFDQQVQRFKADNRRLRRENEELRTASGASSPTGDYRRYLEDTDSELQTLRRSLAQYQDAYVEKERMWRGQVDALKEENEALKTTSRTPSSPGGSGQGDSDSGGSASYVHIELTTTTASGAGTEAAIHHQGQPSPNNSGGSSGGGVVLVEAEAPQDRRDSREMIFLDEEVRELKSLVDDQRRTIGELQEERNRLLLQLEDGGTPIDQGPLLAPVATQELEHQHQQMCQQLNEMVEALNEKTEECERTRRELEQARRETEERDDLVQQFNMELKGLELQLADNREREQQLRNESAELEQKRADAYSQMAQLSVALKSTESERDQLRSALEKMELEIRAAKETIESQSVQIDRAKETAKSQSAQLVESRQSEDLLKEKEQQQLLEVEQEVRRLETELESEKEKLQKLESEYRQLSIDLEGSRSEKVQLIMIVNQKHEESLRYHQECQRLGQLLTEAAKKSGVDAQVQKDDEEREKLREELRSSREDSERKTAHLEGAKEEAERRFQQAEAVRRELASSEENCGKMKSEIDRLRGHLVQIEEAYTQEAVHAEQREAELRKRLREAEHQLEAYFQTTKDGTDKLSGELCDLRTELRAMADQRDSALLQYADSQIEAERQQKALASLQAVLQHMQQERDLMVMNEVARYKRERDAIKDDKLKVEATLRQVQNQLQQYEQNMLTASSISEQLAAKDKQMADMKAEISAKEDECAAMQAKLNELQRAKDAKIDKEVLKNILLGYFCAPAGKKAEVAHLLGAILGFSEEEFGKVDSGGGGWLQFLRQSQGGGRSTSTEQSLAAQFVQFLETESAPKPPPALAPSTPTFPVMTGPTSGGGGGHHHQVSQVSRSSSPGGHQLPTFLAPPSSIGGSEFLRDLLSSPKPGDANIV